MTLCALTSNLNHTRRR